MDSSTKSTAGLGGVVGVGGAAGVGVGGGAGMSVMVATVLVSPLVGMIWLKTHPDVPSFMLICHQLCSVLAPVMSALSPGFSAPTTG